MQSVYRNGQAEKSAYFQRILNIIIKSTWHENESGWWFEYSGGGYPGNTWEDIPTGFVFYDKAVPEYQFLTGKGTYTDIVPAYRN